MIDFGDRDRVFAHHNLEMVNQRFHFGIYTFLRRQVIFRHIGMEIALRQIFNRLLYNLEAFAYFAAANAEAVVGVARSPDRYFEVEIFIRTIRLSHTYIVIDSRGAEVGSGESVIDCPFGRNCPHVDGAVHENAVALERFLKLVPGFWKTGYELVDLFPSSLAPISFETPYTSHVGGEAGAAYFFENFVSQFPVFHHIEERGVSTQIDSKDTVADEVVGDTCNFHDNHAHVLCPLGDFHFKCLFYGHPPAHVVDGRRTIVEAVGKRSYLIECTLFRNLLECPVDVTHRSVGIQDIFAIHQQNVLKHSVGGWVGRPEVQDRKLSSVFQVVLPDVFFERMLSVFNKYIR